VKLFAGFLVVILTEGFATDFGQQLAVLSELPEREICSLQFMLPVVIGIHLLDKHCAVFSTVTG
jgi:hypothetical protein